jgi:hypothetical protein
MKLSRRDVFKLGGLAAVGAAGLAIPLGHTVNGASASLLSAAKMPKPYQSTVGRLEVQSPYRTEVDAQGPVAYYDVSAKTGAVGMVPGMLADILRCQPGIGILRGVVHAVVLLPQGEYDVAITLSDMVFAANGPSCTTTAAIPGCGAMSSWSTAGPGQSSWRST